MHKAIVSLSVIGLIFTACTSPLVNIRPNESAYRAVDPASLKKNLSEEIVLIADNQFHSLKGHQSWLQQGISDKMVHVAIRPPLLNYYSDRLLRHILIQNKNKLFIHLGDAADISCTNEMTHFLSVMDQETGGAWLMAPGNHDSLYFGNYEKNDQDKWSADCDVTGSEQSAFMNKQRFMQLYLENKLGDKFDPQGVSKGHKSMIHGPNFNAVAHWKIEPDDKENWDSFLLQFVDISANRGGEKVWMILLDTTQYGNDPKLLFSSAGKKGTIGQEQWKIVETFVDDNRSDRFVLAGHSPLNELDKTSIAKIIELRQKHALIYLSAHTHQGNWFVYQHKSIQAQMLELNIGSTTDARYMGGELIGPGYRTFQLFEHPNGLAIKSDLVRWNEDNLQCESRWFMGNKYYSYETRPFNFKETKIGLLKMLVEFHECEQKREFRLASGNIPVESASGHDERERVKSLIARLEHIRKITRLNPKYVPDPLRYQACQAYWASLRENYNKPNSKLDQNKRATFEESVTAVSVPVFR